MRVLRLRDGGGLDNLRLERMDDPGDPGPGEVRLRVEASSLNFHDLGVALGGRGTPDGRIPLSDAAGRVEAVGEGVADLAPGDLAVSCFFPDWQEGAAGMVDHFGRVPGDGIDGYAREAVVVPATWLTRAPRGWSAMEAATITTAGLTAWRALVVDGALRPGEWVLALGTGGVSVYALQIAKAMGARVVVTSSSDGKLERARALGADHAVNHRRAGSWADAVLEATGGRGVDHAVEVGGAGTLPQSIRATRVGGHIAMIGVLSGRSGEIPTGLLMRRQQRLQGLVVGSRRHQLDFVQALEGLRLRPVVDRVFPLGETAEAFRLQQGGGHFGKIGIAV